MASHMLDGGDMPELEHSRPRPASLISTVSASSADSLDSGAPDGALLPLAAGALPLAASLGALDLGAAGAAAACAPPPVLAAAADDWRYVIDPADIERHHSLDMALKPHVRQRLAAGAGPAAAAAALALAGAAQPDLLPAALAHSPSPTLTQSTMSPQAAHPALAYAAAPLQLMQHHQQHPHQQFHLVYPQQLHASPPPPAFPALSINTGVSPASAAQPFDGADAATPGSAAPPSSAATAMPTAAYHPAFGTVAMPLGGIPMGMSMGVSVLGVDAAGMPVQVQMQMPVQMVQLPVPLDDATTPTAASPYGLGLGLAGMPVNMVGVPVNVVGIDAAGMPVGVVGMPMALDAAGMPVQVQMQMPVGVVGMVPAAADEAQQPQQPADSPRSTAARARHLRGAGHARSLSASGTAAGHARPAVSSPLAAADPSASADPRAADPARPAGLRSRSLSTSAAAADGDPDAARDDHTGAFVLARHVHSPASPDSFGSSPGAISPAVSIASASQSGIPPLSPSAILPPPTSSNNSNPSTSSGNPKPFKCEMCASTFSRNHDLKRHVRIHLGIRPYRCDLCGKSFTRMDALHRHTSVRGCKTITTKSGVLGAGLDDDDDEAMSPTADGPGDDAVPASISLAAAAALKAEKRSSR